MDNCFFFFSSRRRHTRSYGDWSSDVCSSDLAPDSTMMIIPVNLGSRSYRIIVESGALDTVGARLAELRVGSRTARSEERRVGKEGRCRWGRQAQSQWTVVCYVAIDGHGSAGM